MSEWKKFKDVEIENIYQSIGIFNGEFLIKLRVPSDDSIISDYYEISIQNPDFINKIKQVFNDEVGIHYFSYGMQDIDIYKTNKGDYGITHSPHEGLNIQFLLHKNAKGIIINLK